MATLACALFWFHPGAWWAARRLRVERELACDDRVIAAGTEPRDYAHHNGRSCGSCHQPADGWSIRPNTSVNGSGGRKGSIVGERRRAIAGVAQPPRERVLLLGRRAG